LAAEASARELIMMQLRTTKDCDIDVVGQGARFLAAAAAISC
jgi:hypothetical protein